MAQVVLAALALLLSGCIGIESRISFNADGSGRLQLRYRVSRLVVELGAAEQDAPAVPLPVNEDDFRRAVEAADGVRLLEVAQESDPQDVTITALLEFDTVEQLAQVRGFADLGATLEQGQVNRFEQVIVPGRNGLGPLDDDTRAMLEALFSGYEVAFVVQAPATIQSSTPGERGADGRSLTVVMPLPEFVSTEDRQTLVVEW